MEVPPGKPTPLRRLAAAASLILLLGLVALAVVGVATRPLRLLVVVALLFAAVDAAWYAVSRAGGARRIAAALGIAAAATAAAIVVFSPGWQLLVRVPLFVLALVLARYALSLDTGTLKAAAVEGSLVPAARAGALIMNLKSGGGKAERFHLVDECRSRGIEPVVLRPGDDLLELAKRAIDDGCDAIGMAGGDGSQALVASVAAERGVPMVVVPAGTRNHLALDLGLDRADVVGALDAFGEAVERTMDLAEVNGRIFVNNVSLGLYATIVRSPEYRDAKRDTTLRELPRLLGPECEPFDLRFAAPDGKEHAGAHVIQVSNGPYGQSVLGQGTRPRLDTGQLGVVTVTIPSDEAERRFVRALARGRPRDYEGFESWETLTFRVESDSPIPVGLDGESIEMEPPLVFTSRPGVLRIRLPKGSIGYSPAARAEEWRTALPRLWRIVRGRP